MKNRRTSRRRASDKHALRSAINEATRPSYSELKTARELAHKLMGIPEMHSINYVNKERRAVLDIAKIMHDLATYLEYHSRLESGTDIHVLRKNALDRINASIESSNEYRQHNQLLLLGIPKLQTITLDTITNSIRCVVVVLECRRCSGYLTTSTEKSEEMCEICSDELLEHEAFNNARDDLAMQMFKRKYYNLSKEQLNAFHQTKGHTLTSIKAKHTKALTKARKSRRSNSSTPSFYSKQLNPYSSINSRGRMDMNNKNIANMQRQQRLEVCHK